MRRARRAGVLAACLGVLTACSNDSTAPDGEAPTVSIAVTPCCVVTTPGSQVTVTATASDNVGVQHVAFFARAPGESSAAQFADDNVAPYTAEFPPAGFVTGNDGSYQVWAKAYDAAGNSAISTAVLTVDFTAPTATLSVPGRVTFDVAFPVTVNASEPLLQIDLYDGDSLVASAYEPTLPKTLFENITAAHNGRRVFSARVRDRAGNEAATAPESTFVDIRWLWDATADLHTVLSAVTPIAGAVYAAGSDWSSSKALLIKLDSSGTSLWTRTFGTAGVPFFGTSVSSDIDGNAYVGVWTVQPRDCIVVKYDPSGAQVWSRLIDSGDQELTCLIGADGSGNVYLTGVTLGKLDSAAAGGTPEIFLMKFDRDGNRLWLKQGTSVTLFASQDLGLAVDAAGAVYITGVTADSGNPTSAFVLKVDAAGNEVWHRLLVTDASGPGGGVAVDSLGAVYVTGVNYGGLDSTPPNGSPEVFVAKYDQSGALIWTRQFGTRDVDIPEAITIDARGAYVVGYTWGAFPDLIPSEPDDIFLARFDGSGTLTDHRTYDARGMEEGFGAATDGTGAVYVAGQQRSYPRGLVLKYRPAP